MARGLKGWLAATALRLPAGWVATGLRATRPAAVRAPAFGSFERADGRSEPLLTGYRAHGKGRWRRYWWSTRALRTLDARGLLPAQGRALAGALAEGRTLPAPVGEFATAAVAIAEAEPELLQPTGRTDEALGLPIVAAVPIADELAALAEAYAAGARAVLNALEAAGLDLPNARMLEVGCGRGYTAAAFAGAGAAEVTGVDLDVLADAVPEELRVVQEVLAAGRPVTLADGDLRALPYADGSFDAVTSLTVLEHVDDVSRAFAELRRVTAPRGLAYHGIDPWFGPAGGHSLCTLDFPWGHVRLEEEEFERYLRELRPHEAAEALDQHRNAFQRPRLTLGQIGAAARAQGFELLAAWHTRLAAFDPHRAWFSGDVLRDCRRLHPAVGPEDLLSVSGTLILRRR